MPIDPQGGVASKKINLGTAVTSAQTGVVLAVAVSNSTLDLVAGEGVSTSLAGSDSAPVTDPGGAVAKPTALAK
jgi:hypothetical protein